MRISEAFTSYDLYVSQYEGRSHKTRKNYRAAMNCFIKAVGDIPIELLTMEAIIQWKLYMEQQGQKTSSIKAKLLILKPILRFVRSKGMQTIDPRDIEMPKVIKTKPVWLEHDEVNLILDAAQNERDAALIALLWSTGGRISELLNLNVEDVRNNDEPMVCGKGDKYRQVFIDKKARQYLDDYLYTRHDTFAPLFMSGQRRRLTVQRAEQIVHECAQRAGIEKNVTPHVFRHSNITDYILNGAPMALVQKMAGHSNIQTTIDIYTHIQHSDIRNTFQKYHKQ